LWVLLAFRHSFSALLSATWAVEKVDFKSCFERARLSAVPLRRLFSSLDRGAAHFTAR
jgi:hypothetical protein